MKYEKQNLWRQLIKVQLCRKKRKKNKKFGEIKTNPFQIVFASANGNFIVLGMGEPLVKTDKRFCLSSLNPHWCSSFISLDWIFPMQNYNYLCPYCGLYICI